MCNLRYLPLNRETSKLIKNSNSFIDYKYSVNLPVICCFRAVPEEVKEGSPLEPALPDNTAVHKMDTKKKLTFSLYRFKKK